MLHPSYSDLMNIVNSEVEEGEQPVVNSRYSIVLATAKRARQLADGDPAKVKTKDRSLVTVAAKEIAEGAVTKVEETEEE